MSTVATPEATLDAALVDIRKHINENLIPRSEAGGFATKDNAVELGKKIDALEVSFNKAIGEIKVSAPNVTKDENCGFAHEGDYYKAVIEASTPHGKVDERLTIMKASTASTMNVYSGPDGGYAFPPGFSTKIMEKVIGDSEDLTNLVDNVQVDGVESLTLLAPNETSRVNGSRWGGIQGYWKSELAQMTTSKPTLREIKLEPKELYVFGQVSDKALRNSPTSLADYFNRAAVDELKFKIGDGIINGTGVGQPLGMLGATCKITATAVTNQAAGTIVEANLAAMWKRLPARSRKRAVWLANQDIDDQLDLMVSLVKNVAGTENVGGVQKAGLYDPAKGEIHGRPIVYTEYSQTLGTEGDLMLIDPLGYVLGRRGTINSAMSMHLLFDFSTTAFRLIFEVDGQPYLKSAITPFNGSNTQSTIITLATRS